MSQATLSVRGAAEHNLNGIDLDLPHECLIAFSGVSGSGKSSLAFDTIYAEARRRFLMTLEAPGKSALRGLRAPRVREITGLAPAVAIDQDRGRQSPRSTVATLSGLHDFLRVLFARLGQPRCLTCDEPVYCQRFEEVYETAAGLPEGTRLLVLAPRPVTDGGSGADFLSAVERSGYRRLRIDGDVRILEDVDAAELSSVRVEVVVDRLVVKGDSLQRLKGSLQAALEAGEGQVGFVDADGGREARFSVRPACSACGAPFTTVSPTLLSFNSQQGACPACRGLGVERELKADRILAASVSMEEALGPLWLEFGHADLREKLERFCQRRELDMEVQLGQWPPEALEKVWKGEGRRGGFLGLARWLERLGGKAADDELSWLEGRLGDRVCDTCAGSRLSPEALAVKIGTHSIGSVARLSVDEALAAISSMSFDDELRALGEAVSGQVTRRLATVSDLGLGYLSLDRGADTLSSGEFQRTRLAAALGTGMSQILYVLDEPSVGLHARDAERLAAALRGLCQARNTVIVVEHDPAIIRTADLVVDLGPGAGVNGGNVVAIGTPSEVANSGSPTGRYLAAAAGHRLAASRERSLGGERLELLGASGHNLKAVDLAVPLGCLVLITGVSGSGKTSLIRHTLQALLSARLHNGETRPLPFRECRGTELLERVVAVEQRPMGRTSRSNAATYTGVFAEIRRLFAQLPDAKLRGYTASSFSFNSPQGACQECGGSGVTGVSRGALEELAMVCPGCQGRRYNSEVLYIAYRHRTIADVLELSVEEALEFFGAVPQVARRLALLKEMGLGYLHLGQPAGTLSGGEAQRVKLCAELSRPQQARTLYILDEPTTGLHLNDIHYLVMLLQRMVDDGNTVLVVEHNIELIAAADYIVDLGPEAGAAGGEVVVCGSPAEVAASAASHTGQFLGRYLETNPARREHSQDGNNRGRS